MHKRPSKRWILASEPRTFTPKRVDKNIRVIRDPEKFAKFITKRDRELLDRLEEYDRRQVGA
jgi:hypothetical protein